MLCKRILPLMALLISVVSPFFAPVSTALATEEVTEERSPAYRTYEVQKGDTLWGISKKFIEDPYYWPDLWANNPDIQNPHFISPGQNLRIYSGPIVVVGVEEEAIAPALEQEVVTSDITPVQDEPVVIAEEPVFIAVPAGISFISLSEQSAGGTIFDYPVARHFAGSGDTVFVRVPAETSVAVGDQLQIVKSRADIIHPVSKKRFGFQVDQLGVLEITALGKDLHTAIIRKSYREVERGAWLSPQRALKEPIALRRATTEMNGMVIATALHKEMQGPNEVLFVDLGEDHGLKTGNLLTLTRPYKATDLVTINNSRDAAIVYPEELIGYALVVDTNPETATAVILKALGPVVIGDQVRAQTGTLVR
ncbi:MAG: LysM peptidoglycan-binding domain-containing protein [Desulfuromonadales bacterium]|nr:LysM peptidoglycan-binding domain-containing protein [Desulfuromonadales bacterium]